MVPAPPFRTTLLAGPLALVGPAAVTLRVSPASASLAVASNLVTERTRLVFAVPPAVLSECVGGVFTITLVVPAADVQPLTVAVTLYVPALADRVTPAIVGFWSLEAKPLGPVQA